MFAKVRLVALLFCSIAGAEETQPVTSFPVEGTMFHCWYSGDTPALQILVLIPGYNGSGRGMMDKRWRQFATDNQLALLAPDFRHDDVESIKNKGYYYPEQGSGGIMKRALAEAEKRTGADADKALFCGFSAGAHFCHRFAMWAPNRVKAFVAYSAGWWSDPNPPLKKIPALIMCGEDDERYQASFLFFKKGQSLGCPWLWRSYGQTGHHWTPRVRGMAEAFLACYAGNKPIPSQSVRYGDIQAFQTVPKEERDTIPEEERVALPDQAVAEVWEQE